MHAIFARAKINGPEGYAFNSTLHLFERQAVTSSGIAIAKRAGKIAIIREPQTQRKRPYSLRFAAGCALQCHGTLTPDNTIILHKGQAMTIPGKLQPDQKPQAWDDHVCLYEEVFEPLSQSLALKAIEALSLKPGASVIDSGAGSGGAALKLARLGMHVTAIDASAGMVARLKARAANAGLKLDAMVMDGQRLTLSDASFDAALSVFGVILYPDAAAGLSELRRVVKPGGRIALVTWTEPEAYELVLELRAAAASVVGELPAGALPAQLRFKDKNQFQTLFDAAGLSAIEIDIAAASLKAPSPRWLTDRLAFAPGMAALLASFCPREAEVLAAFRARLERRFGGGEVELDAKAFIGVGEVPARR
jgi:SAM-dependent methyltransferase